MWKEMILNTINIVYIQKLIIILSALFPLIIKIKHSFSSKNRKQDLKQDIEILDLLKKQNNFNYSNLEDKINKNLEFIYSKDYKLESGFTGFLTGLAIFVGFGLWSFNIYNSHENFNGWIILTMFMAAGGFSMMLMDSSIKSKIVPYYKIGFFNRTNMVIGLIFILISGLTTFILISKLNSFTYWYILLGLIFFLGLTSIIRNIKKIN